MTNPTEGNKGGVEVAKAFLSILQQFPNARAWEIEAAFRKFANTK